MRESSENEAAPTTPRIVNPSTGALYRQNSTGREFEVAGHRSKGRVCLIHDAEGDDREVLDYLPVLELEEKFAFLKCNHTDFCCSNHNTHSQPHRGCLLR